MIIRVMAGVSPRPATAEDDDVSLDGTAQSRSRDVRPRR